MEAFSTRDNHHPGALAGGKRFQPRLLFLGHTGLGLAEIDDDVLPFLPLDGGVDDLAHATDVLVVNRVALGLADLLKDDLLGKLRRNAAQNVGRFIGAQLAAHLSVGIDSPSVFHRDLQVGIFHQLRRLHDALHRIGANLAGFLVQFGAQGFLGLVVLARGDNNGIFHRADHDLGINALLPAQRVDYVVEFTRHNFLPPYPTTRNCGCPTHSFTWNAWVET